MKTSNKLRALANSQTEDTFKFMLKAADELDAQSKRIAELEQVNAQKNEALKCVWEWCVSDYCISEIDGDYIKRILDVGAMAKETK